MEKEDQKHHHHSRQQLLQLLPPPAAPPPPAAVPPPVPYHPSSSSFQWNFAEPSTSSKRDHFFPTNKPYPHHRRTHHREHEPPLDLQLSISLRSSTDCILTAGSLPVKQQGVPEQPPRPNHRVEALKRQAAEQKRLAAMEKAHAERVREMTRKEMELAQAEFARARVLWERARDELARVERLKESSIRRIDNSCMEVTCHSCRQRFRTWPID